MQSKPLSFSERSSELDHYVEIIKSGRFFNKISKSHIKQLLSLSELISLNVDENLILKDQVTSPELILLLEGSLVVLSKGQIIMRLKNPGDFFGEFSGTAGESNQDTDFISEEKSKVFILPSHIFKASDDDTEVSVAYLIFSHILAEKIKHLTAQSMLKKNVRSHKDYSALIGILDTEEKSRSLIYSSLRKIWNNANIIQIESFNNFVEKKFLYHFDLLIVDPENINIKKPINDSIDKIIYVCNPYSIPIIFISKFCRKEDNRKFLAGLGITDFLIKPCSEFDLQHALTKFRNDHYRQKELEMVEIEADTDKLTGLANRRRLDEFIDALVTIFPEDKRAFSLIMADVDHFKYYNDTYGHQMGDIVLANIASIFKKNIRRGDLAARYGGEEFVVILPNCTKKNALLIGNKLRAAISDENFQLQEKQPMGNLTCTFGIATYPDDADTKELLLKRADECLYDGKASGRDVVVTT